MIFFDNIFASSYKHFSKQKRIDPSFHAKLIIVIYQSLALLLFVLIINEYFKASFFTFLSRNKLFIIIIYIFIIILNYRYYTKERMDLYIHRFNAKSIGKRRLWALITGLMPILLLGSFFLILLINHPVG
jgi:uncharacterized membrane-anchored protein